MRLVSALLPALAVTLILFGLMQYLISSGHPGVTRPDSVSFLRLLRVAPDTSGREPRNAPSGRPERPVPPADMPAIPLPLTGHIEAPASAPLAIALPAQPPLDLGDGPTLPPFDAASVSSDNSVPGGALMNTARPQPNALGASPSETMRATAGGGPGIGLEDNGTGVGDVVPLLRVEPVYPRQAARNGEQGWVKIEFTITEQGIVVDPAVVDARPGRTFDRSALTAIRQWRFQPRIVNGKPVAVRATQVIEFRLGAR